MTADPLAALPCEHDHTTCDSCGMGMTALTRPLAAAPPADSLDAALAATTDPDNPPPGKTRHEWYVQGWYDRGIALAAKLAER